jgi:D-alanyl-D-alanine carboxypeptidase/D-alanyl-D-alanine-endopeptidase (penicillin-binding protein 4)
VGGERMKKYGLAAFAAVFWVLLPGFAQGGQGPAKPGPERIKSASEEQYLKELKAAGRGLASHGVYIEALDGSAVLADHRSNVTFNPASVIKIATSFTALDRFGPDHKFETVFLASGEINKKTKTLKGDLVLSSDGDPVLTAADITALIQQVTGAGVAKVTGGLVVSGPFTYGSYSTTDRAARYLEAALKKRGVQLTRARRKGTAGGSIIARHESRQTLSEILFVQNAYSDNVIAERLGLAVGGPRAVERFLVDSIGIPAAQVRVQRASGLESNRITPRGTVQLLQRLVLWLNIRGMLPQDVLPVAGMDVGTLRTRFTSSEFRGAVVGKTGTLPRTEGGVSTLAGFVYTRDRGVLVFAIFNNGSNVNRARTIQDNLLKNVIHESGGAELSGSWRRSSN